MCRTLSELISRLRQSPRPSLSVYQGDDWREHVLPSRKLTLYRNYQYSLSIIMSPRGEYKVLVPGEILVIDGEIRLSTGERLREGNSKLLPDTVGATAERDSVFLELQE